MASSYFGDGQQVQLGDLAAGLGSRKGKRSSSSKQKEPQRGLGVAQLEKIRLQNEMDMAALAFPPASVLAPSPPLHADLNKQLIYLSSSSSSSSSSCSSSCAATMAASSSLIGAHPNIKMAFRGSTGSEISYDELCHGAAASASDPSDHILRQQQLVHRTRTMLPLIEQNIEESVYGRHERRHPIGPTGQNPDSDLDLELRLSL